MIKEAYEGPDGGWSVKRDKGGGQHDSGQPGVFMSLDEIKAVVDAAAERYTDEHEQDVPLAASERLRLLASDVLARGYEPMSLSVLGVADLLDRGDPTEAALAHDEWVHALGRDHVLLRLLGPGDDPYHAECAFPAAVMVRVILEVNGWLADLSAAADACEAEGEG